MSCFVVLFSVLFRLQLRVLGPTALKLFEYSSLVFLCLSAPSHKIGLKTEKRGDVEIRVATYDSYPGAK